MGHNLGNNYGKMYGFQSKPVWVDAQWTVNAADSAGYGVTAVKGQAISQVYMHTSATPATGNVNPATGYALIKLAYNYNRIYAGGWTVRPTLTGSNLAINASALTAGTPYEITAVGHADLGAVTIAPVADSAGSLASSWFSLYDAYGNTFIIWFSVSGVGARPNLGAAAVDGTPGLHYIQQSITTGDSAATIGAALVVTIAALPSGISGVYSFTAAGTTTVTATSTATNPYGPVAGPPSDGTVATGFTFAKTKYNTNNIVWQAVGLPKGVAPAVGVQFVATATGYSTGGGSSGTVKAFAASSVAAREIVGDSNLSIAPIPMDGSPNVGGWVMVRFLDYAGALVAPTDGTIMKMTFLLEAATRVGGNNE